uniref:Uncharacterized protein n=1 Tax=Oryza barthii TaxID=65489 RepID=A0A0D3HUU7_9ORYZ
MAPVAYYHGKLYMDRKHLVDVTEIFRQLNWEKKYRMIKLAFYFICYYFPILEMSDSKAPTSAFTLLFLAMASFPAVSSITLLYSRRLRFFSSVFWCRSATAGTTNPPPPPAAAVPPMLPRLLRLLILR